jgi:TolC family type I secretion outer membrane protein
MKHLKTVFILAALTGLVHIAAAQSTNAALPGWVSEPMSLNDAVNIALRQNATILEAQDDLQASHGLVVQTRAVVLPQLQATGQYKYTDPHGIESFAFASNATPSMPSQNWNTGLQLVQNIYEGGQLSAAIKAARATKKQALAQYETTVADTLLNVQVAYYDVLLAAQQITVNEASVALLQKELDDQKSRMNAGTVPHFNVLRAEVAVANERPALIQAKNNYRNTKNTLSNLLGYNLPRQIWQDIPLNLIDTLAAEPYDVNLPDAIQTALTQRTELESMRETTELQRLNIISAKAGYKPVVSLFAGYGWHNAQFTPPVSLDHEIDGWDAGAQVSWNIFDGALTYGKVIQAKAQYEKSKTSLADESRQIELQVRTAYSDFTEAKETLDSQQKVVEEAEESLREAKARTDAGTGTQLDVLDAETSLTQSRTTQIQALHDYSTARARLERAIGNHVTRTTGK